MVSRRLRRRAIFAFFASAVAFIVSISLFTPDRPAQATASQTETDTPKAEAARSDAPALALKDQQPPSPTAGSPGTARICLTDKEIHLGAKDEIVIPATTVFEDDGPNTGKLDEPSTWQYEVKEGFKFPAKLVTLTAVSLRKNAPCGEANVQMLIGAGATETMKRASDKHIFVIDDVLDYPIPPARPPVEIGRLIDDVSVQAMLISDVTQSIERQKPDDEATEAANCLAGARKLAAYLGGYTGRQTRQVVMINGAAGPDVEVSFGCPTWGLLKADIFVGWLGRARPRPETFLTIAAGGEFMAGATRDEIMNETTLCITAALKPDAMELADVEFRGAKIECHAFLRDGGGGSVTVYRRFGSTNRDR